VLAVVRSLLDQLQLDPNHELSLESGLATDLGVDSLALVELCDLLERAFDVSIDDEVFLTATTPRDWLAAVRRARDGDAGSVSSPFEARNGPQGVRSGAPSPGPFRRLTQRRSGTAVRGGEVETVPPATVRAVADRTASSGCTSSIVAPPRTFRAERLDTGSPSARDRRAPTGGAEPGAWPLPGARYLAVPRGHPPAIVRRVHRGGESREFHRRSRVVRDGTRATRLRDEC